MLRQQDQQGCYSLRDTRKDRKRSRQSEQYSVDIDSYSPELLTSVCASNQAGSTLFEADDRFGQNISADPAAAKLIYREATQLLDKDRLQPTWGRIQQLEELEYERIVELLTTLRHLHRRRLHANRKVLEEFEGIVEKFENDIAHITLKTISGEILYGEYPAVELRSKGIREHRRFKCWTVEVGSAVEFVMEPIPDQHISEEYERLLDERLRTELGEDDAPQNDY